MGARPRRTNTGRADQIPDAPDRYKIKVLRVRGALRIDEDGLLPRRPTRFGPPGVRDTAHGAEKFLRRALGRAYVLQKYF